MAKKTLKEKLEDARKRRDYYRKQKKQLEKECKKLKAELFNQSKTIDKKNFEIKQLSDRNERYLAETRVLERQRDESEARVGELNKQLSDEQDTSYALSDILQEQGMEVRDIAHILIKRSGGNPMEEPE